MPTNIINGSAGPAVGGNAFQTIGSGMQGLAGVLAGAMQAREADKAAKLAEAKSILDAAPKPTMPNDTGFTTQNPWEPGGSQYVAPPPSQPAGITPPANRFMPSGLDSNLRPGGFDNNLRPIQPPPTVGGLLPQRFPSLFPRTSSAFQTFQYGGV